MTDDENHEKRLLAALGAAADVLVMHGPVAAERIGTRPLHETKSKLLVAQGLTVDGVLVFEARIEASFDASTRSVIWPLVPVWRGENLARLGLHHIARSVEQRIAARARLAS